MVTKHNCYKTLSIILFSFLMIKLNTTLTQFYLCLNNMTERESERESRLARELRDFYFLFRFNRELNEWMYTCVNAFITYEQMYVWVHVSLKLLLRLEIIDGCLDQRDKFKHLYINVHTHSDTYKIVWYTWIIWDICQKSHAH